MNTTACRDDRLRIHFDPFMGIGSTAYVALGGESPVTKLHLEEPRNVIGFELKESYHKAALDNADLARRRRLSREDVAADQDLYSALEVPA